jgi:hypothetical protein
MEGKKMLPTIITIWKNHTPRNQMWTPDPRPELKGVEFKSTTAMTIAMPAKALYARMCRTAAVHP